MHPRLFGIVATDSPVVAVLRRGPSEWSQVSRWDTEAGTFAPGSWIHANLYPQRCDLSPDGQWLAYFTLATRASWPVGPTYLAISRLPWLTALAAWGTCGTWSSGVHFVDDAQAWELGDPAAGDSEPLRRRYRLGLALTRPRAFAVERRHGWAERADSPPYDRGLDLWDERRAPRVTMEKARPGPPGATLTVRGSYAAFRSGQPSWAQVVYAVVEPGRHHRLEGAQWADWDRSGRLLVATTDGRLEVRDDPWTAAVAWSVDAGSTRPDPIEPPPIARRWTRRG